jgi:peptidyl-prolyl cis-trans isomerase B (cyclophilin B)
MKKNLFWRVAVLALAACLLLPCLLSCDDTAEPVVDGKETTASNDAGNNDAGNNNGEASDLMTAVKAEINAKKAEDFEETTEKSEYIKVTVQGFGDIIIRLRPDIAPNTASGIQYLIGYNYYRGLTFHRVLKDSYIHGGCPKGDGTGVSGIQLRGEFADNGFQNPLLHLRGVVSAYRPEDNKNGASCQFLILTKDCPQFDGNRTAFGYVVAGMDVVDAISAVEVQDNGNGEISSPVERVVIEKSVYVKEK